MLDKIQHVKQLNKQTQCWTNIQTTTYETNKLEKGIAAVSIRGEVTAQADGVILHTGKSELFVKIKLTEKEVTGA